MIFIITQRDPFFIDAFLQTFDRFDIPYTVLDLPSFNKGFASGVKKALILYGILGFFKLLFIYLTRRSKFRLRNLVSYEKHEDISTLEPYLKCAASNDVILSLSAPCRIPSEIIPSGVPKYNIHCGALPKYAGMMPIFWQMLDGQPAVTITIHDLAERIDEGQVYAEQRLDLQDSLYSTSVMAKRVSAELFFSLLNGETPNPKPVKPATEVMLSRFPNREEVAQFKRNTRLI